MRAGWQKWKLREVCELINGRAYSKPELLPEGKYPVLRVGNFFTNDHWYYSDLELDENKYCDAGDLLYAWSASFGPRMWTGGKVIFHYHIWKVRHDPLLIDQKFLFHFFLWDTEQVKEDRGAGTTMIHVSKGSMEERDILLPPLPEQHRIVAILDEAFAGIATAKANAEQNLQNARALFESHLQAVFTQRGEGWEEKSLVELGTITSSKRIFKNEYVKSGVPFYRTREIKELANGSEITTELFISEARYAEIKARFGVPKEGDILLTAIGTIGEIWVVEGDTDFYFKDGNVLWLKEFASVDPQFLKYVLLSFVESLNAMARGAAYSALPIQRLNAHRIFVPTIFDQKKIAKTLDALRAETQRLASLYQRKLAAVDELKKSLLHQAFSGAL